MVKKFFIQLLSPLYTLIAFAYYRDIWNIKSALQCPGREKPFLKYIYYNYLSKRGSWIGCTSQFDQTPYFPHGVSGVYISNEAKIGKGCVIFHQVTIGSNTLIDSKGQGSPVIGDNVYIGAGAKIIGGIKIGDNCRIGANAVLYSDMPDNTVAVCAPTRVIAKDKKPDNRYFVQDGAESYWYSFESVKWVKV
jgi:serine O-acetyltransferase